MQLQKRCLRTIKLGHPQNKGLTASAKEECQAFSVCRDSGFCVLYTWQISRVSVKELFKLPGFYITRRSEQRS